MPFQLGATLSGATSASGASSKSFAGVGALVGVAALVGAASASFSNPATASGVGALSGQSAAAFSNAATSASVGVVSGVSAPSFANAGTLAAATNTQQIDGASASAFTNAGTISGEGRLVGVSAPVFANPGVLLGNTSITAVSAPSFVNAGDLQAGTNTQQISGLSALSYTNAAGLTGDGVLAGVSPPSFANAGTLTTAVTKGSVSFGLTPLVLPSSVYTLPSKASGAVTGGISATFANAATLGGYGAGIAPISVTFAGSGVLGGAGALQSASTASFANTATLTNAATIRGSSALSFALAASTQSLVDGASASSFGLSATLNSIYAIDGAAQQSFALSGDGSIGGKGVVNYDLSPLVLSIGRYTWAADVPGQIAGSGSLDFTQAGVLNRDGAISGSATLSFTDNVTGYGASIRTGALDWDFISSGTLTSAATGGVSPIVGAASLASANSAVAGGTGRVKSAADSNIIFGQQGTLRPIGQMVSVPPTFSITPTGVMWGDGALAGNASLTLTNAGDLDLIAKITANSDLSFSVQAEGDAFNVNQRRGKSALAFSNSADFGGVIGVLEAEALILRFVNLCDTGEAPSKKGAGRKRKSDRRLLVVIDGQTFEVNSQREAVELLEKAKELAIVQAENASIRDVKRAKRRKRPVRIKPVKAKISTPSKELKDVVARAKTDIQEIYDRKAKEAQAKALEDDEDAILALIA